MRREKTGVFFPSCGQGHFLYWRASHRASTGASPIHDVRDRWINKRGEKIESEARSRRCAWIARSLSISLRAVNPRLLEDCARSLFPNLASRRESDRLSLSLSSWMYVQKRLNRRPNQLAILALHHKTSRARLPLVRCSSSCTFLCRTHFYLLPLSFHTRCELRRAVTSVSPSLYLFPVGNRDTRIAYLLHGWL